MHCHHIQHEDPCYCYINNENNTTTYATDKDLLDHINNTDVHLTTAEKEKISALSGSTIETITKAELANYATKEDLEKYLTKEEAGNTYLAHTEGGSTIDLTVNTTKLTLDNIELWLTYTNGVLKLNGRVVENDTPTPPPAPTYPIYVFAAPTFDETKLTAENSQSVTNSSFAKEFTVNYENGDYVWFVIPKMFTEIQYVTSGADQTTAIVHESNDTFNEIEYTINRTPHICMASGSLKFIIKK